MKDIIFILKNLKIRTILNLLSSRIFSVNSYYIMGLSLEDYITKYIRGTHKGQVRELNENDISYLNWKLQDLEDKERKEILIRMIFYRKGVRKLYGYFIGDELAALQWLIYPSEISALRSSYRRKYLPLNKTQVMLENIYVFPKFRGIGLCRFLTSELLRKARAEGYKHAVTYIRVGQITSLNDFISLGFKPIRLVKDYKVVGFEWRSLKLRRN